MSAETNVHIKNYKEKEPAKPFVNERGVTVYPTSFLPTKSIMEPSRIPKTIMSGFHIELIHVVMFFAILYFLFASTWKPRS